MMKHISVFINSVCVFVYEAVESLVQPNLHKAVFFLHSWFVLSLFSARCLYYVLYTSVWDIPDAYIHMVLFFTVLGIVKDLWAHVLEKIAGLPLFKRYVASYNTHKEEIDLFWQTNFRWLPWVFAIGYVLAGLFIYSLFVAELLRYKMEMDDHFLLSLVSDELDPVKPVSLDCVLPGVQALAGVGVGHLTARSAALVYCPSPLEAKIGDTIKGVVDGAKKNGVKGVICLCMGLAGAKLGLVDEGYGNHADPWVQWYEKMRGRPPCKDNASFHTFRNLLAGEVQDGTMDLERFKDERGLVSLKQMREVCRTDPKYRAEIMRMGPLAQAPLLGDGKLVVDWAKDIGKATAADAGGPFRSWAARGLGRGK